MDYELVEVDGVKGIRCKACDLTSFHPEDVNNRYCGNCHVYHVSPDLTIHILHHGLPLCGFSTLVPGQWPPGHKWVGIDHADYANCPGCSSRSGEIR